MRKLIVKGKKETNFFEICEVSLDMKRDLTCLSVFVRHRQPLPVFQLFCVVHRVFDNLQLTLPATYFYLCWWHDKMMMTFKNQPLDKVYYCYSCYVLTFDPAQRNAIPRWCTGRKWHIPMASNRKRSRGRIKAYNMGQGEGPTVPIQTDASEENDLWTAWQLFPLDDD